MLRAMGNWIYDRDPYEALQWTQALDDFNVHCCRWNDHNFSRCCVIVVKTASITESLCTWHYRSC